MTTRRKFVRSFMTCHIALADQSCPHWSKEGQTGCPYISSGANPSGLIVAKARSLANLISPHIHSPSTFHGKCRESPSFDKTSRETTRHSTWIYRRNNIRWIRPKSNDSVSKKKKMTSRYDRGFQSSATRHLHWIGKVQLTWKEDRN